MEIETTAIQKCLDILDEINSESESVFETDIYENLHNAKVELRQLTTMFKRLKNDNKYLRKNCFTVSEVEQIFKGMLKSFVEDKNAKRI